MRSRSTTEPTTSAAASGGSAWMTGICETSNSAMTATAWRAVSLGWTWIIPVSRAPLRSRRSATVFPLVRRKPWSAIHSSLYSFDR